MGGGTDLPSYYTKYGGIVISAAIDKYSYVMVEPNGQGPSHVEEQSDYQLMSRLDDLPRRDVAARVQQAILQHFGLTDGLSVFVTSQLPHDVGLGSATAEALALIKALSEVSGRPVNARDLAELAASLETDHLQLPYGRQDYYSIAFGGLNCLTFDMDRVEVTPIALSTASRLGLERRLMLFFTGRPSNWWQLQEERKRRSDRNRAGTIQAFHDVKQAALGLLADLSRDQIDTVGHWLHEGWLAKKRSGDGISDGWIDQWYEAARNAGALGGKLVGPGGGGFLLLYAYPDRHAAITAALTAIGLTPTRFRFEPDGASVLANSDLAALSFIRSTSGAH